MMDVDGDIILDVEPGMEAQDFQMQQPEAEVCSQAGFVDID